MSDEEPTAVDPHSLDPALELRAIGARRKALQEVVKITLFIARLHKALQAVLLMGQPASQIPKHVLESYEKLSYQTQILSNADLINDLVELDRRAESSLHVIVDFATDDHLLGDREDSVSRDLEGVFRQLGDFKRTVQTAVAIRLLLWERGHKAAPLTLPIPLEEIQGHIDGLKAREQDKRAKMMRDIRAMIRDVDIVQSHGNFSKEFRAALEGIKDDLVRNLAHLTSGRDIERMPMCVEWIEVGGDGAGEIDKLSEQAAANQVHTNPEPAPDLNKGASFFQRLKMWLLSPWSVSWSDINRQTRKGRRGRK